MAWKIGLAANLVVALAYIGIAYAIAKPLIQTRQLLTNRLGTATAAIFLTCAVHHGGHSVHMLMPAFGLELHHGLAMRESIDWHAAVWDALGAVVGIYYWTLRTTYGPLMKGAKLFEDIREREQQALELNDHVVQGLATAQLALQLDDRDKALEALEATMGRARRMVSQMLDQRGWEGRLGAGELRRSTAALVTDGPEMAGASDR